MVLGWAKDIVAQCKASGVPVFVKQIGAKPVNREGQPHPIQDRKGGDMSEWPPELQVREMP
jgi:protein gp37